MMPMAMTATERYTIVQLHGKRFVYTDPDNPARVFRPGRGEYNAPNIVGVEAMPSEGTLGEDIVAAKYAFYPPREGGKIPTCGGLYQVKKRLEGALEIAEDRDAPEETATLAVIVLKKGRVKRVGDASCEGFLVEDPEIRGDQPVLDERGIPKGGYTLETPLPLGGGLVRSMLRRDRELARLFQAIYGTENLGEISQYHYLRWPQTDNLGSLGFETYNLPTLVINLAHADREGSLYTYIQKPFTQLYTEPHKVQWLTQDHRGGLVGDTYYTDPVRIPRRIFFRTATSGRLSHRIDENAEPEIRRLLEGARSAPLREAIEGHGRAAREFSEALVFDISEI